MSMLFVQQKSVQEQNQFPGSSAKDAWNAWRLKIARERSGVYVCEDEKQLLCHQHQANLSVLCGKCSENPEDADVKELCGSVPPHPVRCPPRYKSYDCISTYLYTFLCCCSSVLCENSNCMLRIIKKGGAICKKLELYQCPLSFTNFLFNVRLGTGTSYAHAMSSCGIQMFILIISPLQRHVMLQNSV